MIDNALKDKRDSTEKRLVTIVEIYEDVKGLNTGNPPVESPAATLSRGGNRSRNRRAYGQLARIDPAFDSGAPIIRRIEIGIVENAPILARTSVGNRVKCVFAYERFQLQVLDLCKVYEFNTTVINFLAVGQSGEDLFKNDVALQIRQGYADGGNGDGNGFQRLQASFAFHKLDRQAAHADVNYRAQLYQFRFADIQ